MSNSPGWLRGRSFQDWLLLVMALVTVAFLGHVWISQIPHASISLINTPARQLRVSERWLVQFVFRNRGNNNADRVRFRILAANMQAPERLQLSDDFILANPLDPGMDVVRAFVTPPFPSGQTPAKEEPKPAAAPGRGAPAAAEPPAAPAQPAREARNFLVVLQADYLTGGGVIRGADRRRWYYVYREGDGAALQVGEALKERVAQAADALLR